MRPKISLKPICLKSFLDPVQTPNSIIQKLSHQRISRVGVISLSRFVLDFRQYYLDHKQSYFQYLENAGKTNNSICLYSFQIDCFLFVLGVSWSGINNFIYSFQSILSLFPNTTCCYEYHQIINPFYHSNFTQTKIQFYTNKNPNLNTTKTISTIILLLLTIKYVWNKNAVNASVLSSILIWNQ